LEGAAHADSAWAARFPMATKPAKSLRELRLRANPAYELVLFDRLSPSERQALEGLAGDPDGYGVLRPREDPHLSIKSVSRDMALLWFTLQSPGPLPRYVIQTLGEQCDQVIGQMVLDGILAIEADGEMLSGPAARSLVCAEQAESGPETRLAALSRRALEFAEALEITDAVRLSLHLYLYNRMPASRRWRHLLDDQAAVERHLGIGNGATARLLERGWTRLPTGGGVEGWMAWQSQRAVHDHDSPTTYKLYVSPACSELNAGFQATAEATALSRAFFCKVGSDVHGLLRPDKIVVYFREFADLQETAACILEKLERCPAHGVPFTAEVAGAGLLSWGIDPPTEQHSVPWLERESWRLRICNRLATALSLAKASAPTGISAWRFAVDRLRLEGIDTETWAPTRALTWAEPARR
jgi:hypothetical protein